MCTVLRLARLPMDVEGWMRLPRLLQTATCKMRCYTTAGAVAGAAKTIVPIKMAYNSYQTTDADMGQPPLIVMHGLFGSKGNWNTLCKAYQKQLRCKVYSVDARNHGDSPHSPDHSYEHLAADVELFMKDFDIKKARIIGHSMGGKAMMYFTLKHPEKVERVIIVDISPFRTSPSLDSMPPLFEFMAKVHMPPGGTMADARQMVERQLATKINDRSLRAFLVTNLVQRSDGRFSWRINLSALLTNFRQNIAAFPDVGVAQYTGPTLFVGGDKSDHIPKNSLPELKKLFPTADLKYIPDAGHWVHSEKSHEFLKVTADFLRIDAAPVAQSSTAAAAEPVK